MEIRKFSEYFHLKKIKFQEILPINVRHSFPNNGSFNRDKRSTNAWETLLRRGILYWKFLVKWLTNLGSAD